ncbi:MBL fold metallo-hydrolase [uncultured Desulfosarcina sp.]|uniref:MBL fold metallo-hydrolase n=1 Tax=uncultured Desulfosarcina sp. TaxID=218289 RepID=UPI0029C8B3B9|nr:MBL fold metallo-hydrolase [uncultured Desulfosarcina sp.]
MNSIEMLSYVSPIAEGIWLIQGPGKSRFPHSNGFLLQGERTCLIDAGIGAKRIEEIDHRLPIDMLVISHSHPDHILAWHTLADRQLYLPIQTPESVGDLRLLGQRFAADRQDAQYWTQVAARRLGIHPMRRPDARFDDGDILDLGPLQLQAVHSPGHLDDHYCFLETTTGTLFSIDIDFTGFGPWYGNPEGDIERFRASVERLRELPYKQICSAHKPPMPRSEAGQAFDRYLEAFNRQREQVFDLCGQETDLAALAEQSPFFRNRMRDSTLQRIFETEMIRKNLALLVRENRIIEADGRYRWR